MLFFLLCLISSIFSMWLSPCVMVNWHQLFESLPSDRPNVRWGSRSNLLLQYSTINLYVVRMILFVPETVKSIFRFHFGDNVAIYRWYLSVSSCVASAVATSFECVRLEGHRFWSERVMTANSLVAHFSCFPLQLLPHACLVASDRRHHYVCRDCLLSLVHFRFDNPLILAHSVSSFTRYCLWRVVVVVQRIWYVAIVLEISWTNLVYLALRLLNTLFCSSS